MKKNMKVNYRQTVPTILIVFEKLLLPLIHFEVRLLLSLTTLGRIKKIPPKPFYFFENKSCLAAANSSPR